MMAEHYRYIIKDALMEYDNSQTEVFYDALAWKGLMGSGANAVIDQFTGLVVDSQTGENLSTVAWIHLTPNERLGIIYIQNSKYKIQKHFLMEIF